MKKSLVTGLVVGAVIITAGGAVAGLKLLDEKPTHADVLRVTPVLKTVRTPRQVCDAGNQRCITVIDSKEGHIGYDVRYRIGEEEGEVRMNRDPGERIPVRDGKLVLETGPEEGLEEGMGAAQ